MIGAVGKVCLFRARSLNDAAQESAALSEQNLAKFPFWEYYRHRRCHRREERHIPHCVLREDSRRLLTRLEVLGKGTNAYPSRTRIAPSHASQPCQTE